MTRYCNVAFIVLLTACLFVPCALASENTVRIPVGDLEVTAIIDARGSMEAKLLPDLGKYPELAALFAHGPLPSVSKTYFFKTNGHNVLVDTGWGQERDVKGETVKMLKALGIQPDAVTDILLTHLDFDHIGGLVENGRPVYPNAIIWIARPEYEAWLEGKVQKRPEFARELAKKAAGIYKDRIRLFRHGQEILPGIRAIDASGHTPGHTAYELHSGEKKLTIAGDAIHIAQVQLARPDLSTVYDMDLEKAAQARKNLLETAAKDRSLFGGMHFEMVRPVSKRPDGGYAMREAR